MTQRLSAKQTRRAVTGQILRSSNSALAASRQLRAMISDETMGRDGLVVASDGLDLVNYRKNPIVLASHDSDRPIARAVVSRNGSSVMATLQFPDVGVSADADQCLALAQANILSAISIGFAHSKRSRFQAAAGS